MGNLFCTGKKTGGTVILETVIVLVEDDPVIAELIEYNLRSEEYIVKSFRNGRSMIEGLSGDDEVSLFILDIMLPGMDGFEICKWVRANPIYPMTPVIMLTARSSESDKVHGLEAGADDYITKPFGIREFLARVRSQVRRYCASKEIRQSLPERTYTDNSSAKDPKADAKTASRIQSQREEGILEFSGITLDDARHRVFSGDHEIEMTNREYELLKFLMKNRGIAFSRDDLLNSVWGFEYSGETRTVDVHIRQLRKKIEKDDANPVIIETVRGRGYRFIES